MVVIAFLAYEFTKEQFEQAENHKRWQNYNDLNSRYAALFADIPTQLQEAHISTANDLDQKTRNWARRYFDLTSEEFWLHTKHLLPLDMWPCRIAPGVAQNFQEFRNMKLAYEHWKNTTVQIHPAGFSDEMSKIISRKETAIDCAK